ncbi:MAG: ABC transporter permease [Sporichthyaceae bacterium]
MTAIAVEGTRRQAAPIRSVPMSRLAGVELRKMFDTRSGFWLMASIAATAVIATGAVILYAPDEELTYASFGSAVGFPTAVILPMAAILSVTSEWSQRSGLTTFTLVPHRGRVVLAKAVAAIGIGVASMLLAMAIGAIGNVVGTAITGTPTVWDVSLADAAHIVLGNVLGLMGGFAIGVLLRSSAAALVAYFVISFVQPTLLMLLASRQAGFQDLQPWVDVNAAQSALFTIGSPVTGQEWAQLAVTEAVWLVLPLVVGLRLVLRSEIK